MKTSTKLATVALFASIGTAALTAQVSSTGRPAPITLGQPRTANTVSGDGRTEARLAEMQLEIDKLRTELKEANNRITGVQNGLKSTSQKVFGMAPDVAKFANHSHFVNSYVTIEAHTPEGANKIRIDGSNTSAPTAECVSKSNSSSTMWNHKWQNDWDCPAGK